MRDVIIELRRYRDADAPCLRCTDSGTHCVRCSDAGRTAREVVERLSDRFAAAGVRLIYRENVQAVERSPEATSLLVGGVPVEDVVGGAKPTRDCATCGKLGDRQGCCRTLMLGGKLYQQIPPAIIEVAAYRAAGL